MKKNRIIMIEKQVQQLREAINELQARVDFLQKWISAPPDIESLSLRRTQVESRSLENEVLSRGDISKALERTLKVVLQGPKRGVSSEHVSGATGRSRNLESSYLHELHERRYLNRKRIGRNVYYALSNFVGSHLEEKE